LRVQTVIPMKGGSVVFLYNKSAKLNVSNRKLNQRWQYLCITCKIAKAKTKCTGMNDTHDLISQPSLISHHLRHGNIQRHTLKTSL